MMGDERPAPRRTWRGLLRFRLSTLFIAFTAVAIILGVFGVRWYHNLQEEWALDAVKAAGGLTVANKEGYTKRVWLGGPDLDDARLIELLPSLGQMRSLLELDIVEAPVTDESLKRLIVLQRLRDLYIHETKATETGLKAISGAMPNTKLHREKPDIIAKGLVMRNIYRSAIVTAALSPSENWLVTGSGDGRLRWWRNDDVEPADSSQAHENWLFSAVFSADGHTLATGGGDNLIRIWDTASRKPLFELRGHTNDVHTLAFDPSGQILYSAGDDRVLRIWDLTTKRQTAALAGFHGSIPNMSLSHDGRVLATASRDHVVRLWTVGDGHGKLLRELTGHHDDAIGVSFSPDDTELASVSYDRTVRLWNVATGTLIQEFTGHRDWCFCVAFSPDGQTIASGAGDGIRIWNKMERAARDSYNDQKNVSSLRFDRTGKLLVSTAADGTVFVRSMVTGQITRILRTRYGERGLTALPGTTASIGW